MEIKNQIKMLSAVALLSSGLTLGAYHLFNFSGNQGVTNSQSAFTNVINSTAVPGNPGEFSYAAEKSTPAVVHIKVKAKVQQRGYSNPFDDFFSFGNPFENRREPQIQEGSGSGVIISEDGYIVTNNHVIEDAEEVKVILNNKKEYEGKVISTDPSSDIAVVKIDGKDLPFLNFGDSDNIKVGEWVLAVGNPFNLESTVTAGIISAKGRSNIIGQNSRTNNGSSLAALESFIQTDAAVNPGNSGGALVNLNGELIGINTAIYSRTGQFAGYSFAVPVSIVKKVSSDLIKYGNVQRGFLGITFGQVNSDLKSQKDLKVDFGAYVNGFAENSAAKDAGVKINDVITEIDGVKITETAKLVEMIGRKRPGEKVNLKINREGEIKTIGVVLRNYDGNTEIVLNEKANAIKSKFLGAKLAKISASDKEKFKIDSGVKVVEILEEGRLQYYGIEEGFIITNINDKAVSDPEVTAKLLDENRGRVKIQGITSDGSRLTLII
jgi:Do/DeqQ family serine protease